MLVVFKAKPGYTDKQVWDYLLSKNIGFTMSGTDSQRANVPKNFLPGLEKIANVTHKVKNEQALPNPQQVHSG